MSKLNELRGGGMRRFLFSSLAVLLSASLAFGALITPDSYDKLFCRMNNTGTPGTFLDDSTATPKTITANGNATQLPIKFNKSALFLDGASYLVVPNSSDFNLGTGDYTVRFAINFDVVQACNIVELGDGLISTGLLIHHDGSNFKIYQRGSLRITASWTPTAHVWYYVSVIRSSGSTQVYVDGSATGSAYSGSDDIQTGSVTNYIGWSHNLAGYTKGWIKDLEITNNARSSAVPTAQVVADANTKLLLRFDTPATSPLAPAIAFDGTGDYLTVPNGGSFDVADGEFGIQFFFKATSSADLVRCVFDSGINTSKGITVSIAPGASQFLNVHINASLKINELAIAYTVNTWSHFRIERTGGKIYCFQDGRLLNAGGTADTTVVTANSAVDARIGLRTDDTLPMIGELREVIFSSADFGGGAAFTPSQTGFTVDANTKLYIKGDENNGVTTFVDQTGKTVTTNGDTKIKYTEDYRSCIFKDETGKFPYPVGSAKVDFFAIGSGVGYFDGTPSDITALDSADWDFSGGIFTQELYFRPSTMASQHGLIGQRASGDDFNALLIDTDGGINFYIVAGGVAGVSITGTNGVVQANQWSHIAISEDGDNYKIFHNGTLVGSATDTSRGVDLSAILTVGNADGTSWAKGLLDNIRISKGVARYTAAFNPPDDYARSGSSGKRKTNWFFFF